MIHKATRRLGLIFLTSAALCRVHAQAPSAYPQADQADAIVVGEVQSGRQGGHPLAFALFVVRSIKGDLAPGAAISVSGAVGLAGNRDLKGHYGIFFLRKARDGQWTLLPVLQGGVPFETAYFPLSKASSPASTITSATPLTVNDRIAVELAAAVRAYTSPLQVHLLANGLMGMPESAVTQDLFRSLRVSPDPELRFLALAKLLRANDVSALAEIANNIELVPRLTVRSFVIAAIGARRDSDAIAIGYLGRIATSSDIYVQRNAAGALMRIHTRDTLPFLAQLLDSNDPRTRELAMTGFSRFIENLPIETQYNTINAKALMAQGPQPYRTPETDRYSLSTRQVDPASEPEYLRFWRSWWVTMKDKVMAAPGPRVAPQAPPPPSQRP